MAAGTQGGWTGPSRRRWTRFQLQGPLDVTVLRSGVPDTVPGRSLNLGERGMAVMLAGELSPGEIVSIDVPLPLVTGLLRTRAVVRYQDKLRCGLEFLALSAEQRATIREWAKKAKVETEFVGHPVAETGPRKPAAEKRSPSDRSAILKKKGKWFAVGIAGLLVSAVVAGAFWWRWNRGWDQLESGLKTDETAATEKPQVQVPAEVMERLLTHRVEPVYPADARPANLQAIIALDVVVGRDGSVVSIHALNGPDVLARAAMDALRWWRFEPYRVNGQPAVVETTVAVEFKP